MKILVKNECKRTIFSRGMASSLIIGLLIIFWHLYQHVLGPGIENENVYCVESVFYRWIGASSFPMQTYLYYLIIPILAILPGGVTYFEDLKTGYLQNIYTRTKRWKYLLAKYISIALAGGMAVLIPLVVDLYVTCMRFPALTPEPIMAFGPALPVNTGFALFYAHPWIYTFLYLLLDFLFVGAVTGISLITTFFTEYKFAVLITPFVCWYLVFSMNSLFTTSIFTPSILLIPGFSDRNGMTALLIEYLLLLLLAVFFIFKGKRYEAK